MDPLFFFLLKRVSREISGEERARERIDMWQRGAGRNSWKGSVSFIGFSTEAKGKWGAKCGPTGDLEKLSRSSERKEAG